ncbi:Subtilisin-like protease SBT3.3 [Ananas comosus]|uniref:Subtilisin-like protease SBT3.3 n=1 Tax=Ananas comosus TaxID=4615 RepID=A0A199UU97_ANACO|nr:Subtilisin-like protease SBT3.3 [Ananas comosus]
MAFNTDELESISNHGRIRSNHSNLRSTNNGENKYDLHKRSEIFLGIRPCGAVIGVVGDDDGVIPGASGEDPAIPNVVLDVAHDGTLGDGSEGEHVPDHERGLAAAVHELARVHALGADEELLLVLVAEGVAEGDAREGGAAPGVVDDVGDDALEVPVALAEVEGPEPRGALAVVRVGAEHGSRTLTLSSDDPSHGGGGGGERRGGRRGAGLGLGVFGEKRREIYIVMRKEEWGAFGCPKIDAPIGVDASSKLYIVYMGEKKHKDPNHETASHHNILTSLLGSKEEALNSIVYSYKHGFSGFAAMLTDSQAEELAELPEVITVKPNRIYRAHTTRSWDFLGLDYNQPTGLLQKAKYGEDVVIGVVDSCVWPESKSFDDSGYGPIPSRWRGKCEEGEAFGANNCSRKIIGARYYTGGVSQADLKGDFMSPRDFGNHGTHTASTAAGGLIYNASFHNLATGNARGGAPRARLAIYKACWGRRIACGGAALLAAIDDAINDGVDILSLSLGGPEEIPGTLHAVAKGITVVFSAGNDGPALRQSRTRSPG